MKAITLTLLSLLFSVQALATAEFFDTKSQKTITKDEFVEALPESANIVLGEYHYQTPIQNAEGEIIEMIVKAKELQGKFTVAWEFLNYPDQDDIETVFSLYANDVIDDLNLLKGLFPNSKKPEQNIPYLPMFQMTKKYQGELIALNAPRTWKRVITKKGFDALEPQYIPSNMERGSANYEARFAAAMGGHLDPELLENYFMAQSYTDSVMAWALVENSSTNYRFAVAGSFHTDYNDGFVDQLKKYDGERKTVSIKIIDVSKLSVEEVESLKLGDSEYGALADYLYLLN